MNLKRLILLPLALIPLAFASCSAPKANSHFGPPSPTASLNKGVLVTAVPVAKAVPAPVKVVTATPKKAAKVDLYDRSTLRKRVIDGRLVELPSRMRDGKPFKTEVKVNDKLFTYSINHVNWPHWSRNRWQRNVEYYNMAEMVPDEAFHQVANKVAAENATRPEIAETKEEREFIDIGIRWGDMDGDIQRFAEHHNRALAGQTMKVQ